MEENRESDISKAYSRFISELSGDHRLHITDELISLNQFEDKLQKIDHKPIGLWYGQNDSWISWCQSQMPHWLGLYIYEILPCEDQLYQIKNEEDFVKFEEDYKADLEGLPKEFLDIKSIFSTRWMNYKKLSENYSGIEIIPYQYSLRHSSFWYYGWDCASGCIFKKSGIKELRFLAQFDPERQEFVKI